MLIRCSVAGVALERSEGADAAIVQMPEKKCLQYTYVYATITLSDKRFTYREVIMAEKKTSDARMRASIKYAKANLKRFPLDMQKEYFEDVLKPAAEAAGMPISTFIKAAIAEKIARMNEQ